MNEQKVVKEYEFNPSLHIVPLDKEAHVPLMWLGEDKGNENNGNFTAITDNGRISCFPAKWQIVFVGGEHKGYVSSLELEIRNLIYAQFPKGKDSTGKKIKQYLMACVMYGNEKQQAFICKIIGLQSKLKELDNLYNTLHSLQGTTVGDEKWSEVEKYLSDEPIKGWINKFISSLKEQGWADYVRERLDEIF